MIGMIRTRPLMANPSSPPMARKMLSNSAMQNLYGKDDRETSYHGQILRSDPFSCAASFAYACWRSSFLKGPRGDRWLLLLLVRCRRLCRDRRLLATRLVLGAT